MDISPAGPSILPWLVAGALLVVLAGGGALLALRLRRRRRSAEEVAGHAGRAPGSDDLPAFLEFPPGSPGAPGPPATGPPPSAGWPALAGAGPAATTRVAEAPAGPPSRSSRPRTVVLAAVALAALVLLAAALVLDPGPGRSGHAGPHGRDGARSSPAPEAREPAAGDLADVSVRPGRDGGAARLAFGGLVLEQRAVGITASYPALEVTWNRDEAVAHLRLPTYNCLTAAAPEDPVAAGCAPSITEFADLPSPALELAEDDGTVRLSGRFPTYVRPNGSPPAWTGRVYEFSVRTAPVRGEPAGEWVRARGEIRLGDGRAPTLAGSEVRVLRAD